MNKKVAIIGAGLAGCSLAYELSKSNSFDITIFDKSDDLATQASGNFAGILAPYLTSDNNFSDQFHTLGYSLLLDFINQHKSEIEICSQGMLRILTDEKDLKRYQKIFVKRDIDSDLARLVSSEVLSQLPKNNIVNPGELCKNKACHSGLDPESPSRNQVQNDSTGIRYSQIDYKNAVYYPNAVSVVPKSVCELMVKLSNAILSLNSELVDISKGSDNSWNLEFKQSYVVQHDDLKSSNLNKRSLHGEILNQVQDDIIVESNNHKFDIVIFAGGYELFNRVSYLRQVPVYPSHGQLTVINKAFDIDKTIMDKGYIIPNYKERKQVIGATFRDNSDTLGDIREIDNQSNIAQIKEILEAQEQIEVVESRVATRCVTSDHLPLIGKLARYDKFENDFFKPISKGYPKSKMPRVEYEQGLYLASGFGSKGLCSSMIAAKIIATEINQGNHIVSDKLLDALSPQRFWLRSFKKGIKHTQIKK